MQFGDTVTMQTTYNLLNACLPPSQMSTFSSTTTTHSSTPSHLQTNYTVCHSLQTHATIPLLPYDSPIQTEIKHPL